MEDSVEQRSASGGGVSLSIGDDGHVAAAAESAELVQRQDAGCQQAECVVTVNEPQQADAAGEILLLTPW